MRRSPASHCCHTRAVEWTRAAASLADNPRSRRQSRMVSGAGGCSPRQTRQLDRPGINADRLDIGEVAEVQVLVGVDLGVGRPLHTPGTVVALPDRVVAGEHAAGARPVVDRLQREAGTDLDVTLPHRRGQRHALAATTDGFDGDTLGRAVRMVVGHLCLLPLSPEARRDRRSHA